MMTSDDGKSSKAGGCQLGDTAQLSICLVLAAVWDEKLSRFVPYGWCGWGTHITPIEFSFWLPPIVNYYWLNVVPTSITVHIPVVDICQILDNRAMHLTWVLCKNLKGFHIGSNFIVLLVNKFTKWGISSIGILNRNSTRKINFVEPFLKPYREFMLK